MKKKLKIILIAIPAVIFLFLFQNCSDINLNKLGKAQAIAGLKIEHCSEKSRKVDSNLKFIFILDRSHSNQCKDALDVNCEYGTDPMGDRRFPPILDLIEQYSPGNVNDDQVFWSMINFNDQSEIAKKFTNSFSDFKSFVGVRKDVAEQLGIAPGQYGNTGQIDSGSTNYLRALDNAKKLIADDITAAKAREEVKSSTYVIFFISDGEPNELSGDQWVPQDPLKIYSSVDAIVNIGEEDRVYVDGVQFNTAFYYEEFNSTARSLLTSMAIRGKGTYAEFGAGEGINFNSFTIPSRQLRFDLKELWVINNNTIWKEDRLVADTDGDYLADEDEIALKSDPYNSDSDSNGVRDGIEVKVLGIPCQTLLTSLVCSPIPSPLICGSLVKVNGVFDDKDGDKLNSCEEALLGTMANNFDSNNDSVPDSVGLRYDYPIIKDAGNELYIDRDNDKVVNYRELKEGSNFKIPNSQLINLQKMTYNSVKTSEDAEFACYDYTISNIARIGTTNLLTIFALEGTQFVSQKLELRTVDKYLNPAGIVGVESEEFK